MISILILVWGEYTWLTKPLLACLQRQWYRMPAARATNWPPKRMRHPSNFSRLLREELVQMDTPVGYITPVDTFPLGPMNWLPRAAEYIVQAANIVRFGVAHEGSLATHGVPVGDEVLYSSFFNLYRCEKWQSCSGPGGLLLDAALWNRAHLASMLPDAWAIEEVESRGSDRMHEQRPDLHSVGVVPGLFETVKLVDHHRPRTVSGLDRLDPRDAEAVRDAMPIGWGEA